MQFEEINIDKHKEIVVEFRKDSFAVSFGEDSTFDEEDYLNWLQVKIEEYPKGFVLIKENNNYIGQLELSIRVYEGQRIGYVHLYYLIPEFRGKGAGALLQDYALKFFRSHQVGEYHLRVSPMNNLAIHFYLKNGMEKIKHEIDGKVIRMKGTV